MALGIVEIVEEDCGTENYIECIVFSEKHAHSIVGKYYKDPRNPAMDWEVLDFPTAKSLINLKIQMRSTMTCQTPNFKTCQKCFGARKFPTKCVGVVAGQVVSERLTQLIMRLIQWSLLGVILVEKFFEFRGHLSFYNSKDMTILSQTS